MKFDLTKPSTAIFSILIGGIVALSGTPAYAQDDTVCGEDVKEEIVYVLEEASKKGGEYLSKVEDELYKQYSFCAKDSDADWSKQFYYTARQCSANVSYLGSIYWEEMPCCGYDPQRRTFACPVKIKQRYGFGGTPLPGSREYVYHCVADASGIWRPVGDDSVHLSNSQHSPSWQFAVVAHANNNLQLVQPMSGEPRKARSILSWQLRPTSCDYKPIWGNVVDYPIRLDQ